MAPRHKTKPVPKPEKSSVLAERQMAEAALVLEDTIGAIPTARRLRELATLIESGRTLF